MKSHSDCESQTSTMRDARAMKSALALEHAMLSLLEVKQLDDITVADIVERAGVHRATFFRHHPNKESLLEQIAADEIRTLVRLTLPVLDAVDSQASVLRLCAYVFEHRRLWSTLLTGGAAAAMRAEHERIASDLAADRAPANAWLPRELGVDVSIGLIFSALVWWLKQPEGVVSIADAADILHQLLWSILGTRAD